MNFDFAPLNKWQDKLSGFLKICVGKHFNPFHSLQRNLSPQKMFWLPVNDSDFPPLMGTYKKWEQIYPYGLTHTGDWFVSLTHFIVAFQYDTKKLEVISFQNTI